MIFSIKEKYIILTHTVYFLPFATNIPVQLKTGFVVQGHICLMASFLWLKESITDTNTTDVWRKLL